MNPTDQPTPTPNLVFPELPPNGTNLPLQWKPPQPGLYRVTPDAIIRLPEGNLLSELTIDSILTASSELIKSTIEDLEEELARRTSNTTI